MHTKPDGTVKRTRTATQKKIYDAIVCLIYYHVSIPMHLSEKQTVKWSDFSFCFKFVSY